MEKYSIAQLEAMLKQAYSEPQQERAGIRAADTLGNCDNSNHQTCTPRPISEVEHRVRNLEFSAREHEQ